MLVRLALLVVVVGMLSGAAALWRRPPGRLSRSTLAGLGVRRPAIVQFTTRHCAPCKAAEPHLRRAAEDTRVPFVQVDVGEDPAIARTYGIRSVPTIAVTGQRGKVVEVWTSLPEPGILAEATSRAEAAP